MHRNGKKDAGLGHEKAKERERESENFKKAANYQAQDFSRSTIIITAKFTIWLVSKYMNESMRNECVRQRHT